MNPFDPLNDVDSGTELPEILGADDDESFESDDDDDKLFLLEQLAWQPTPTQGKLVAIAVGKDTIVVGTDKRVVILLKVGRDPQLFIIGKQEGLIHKLFVDSNAEHLFVTMTNGTNFYINLVHSSSSRKQTKTPLSKVKGITIESMVWSKNSFRDSTGLCLVGTANGCIYSLQISEGKEKIFNKLYDLKTGSYGTSFSDKSTQNINHSESTCFRVCGLHIEYLNVASLDIDDTNDDKSAKEEHVEQSLSQLSSFGFVDEAVLHRKKSKKKKKKQGKDRRFYIIAVIPSKIFEFIGGPTFDEVFKSYEDKRDIFMEIPGSLKHTQLCVYKPHNQMAEAIGWLTEPGIVLCRPVFGSHVTAKTGVIGENIHENIIPYGGDNNNLYIDNDTAQSSGDSWHGMEDEVPLSFAVTQFHIMLVYAHCYLVINRLSRKCVSYEKVPCKAGEHVVDIAIADHFIYIMTLTQIFQIRAQDESRDVWQLFLSNQDFVNAKKYARNNWQKSKILRCEAEYYFETDRFNEAALKYVELTDIEDDKPVIDEHNIISTSQDISFEEISLKFLNAGANDALMTFLREKLNRMHNDDQTQRVILATWLTEMHLSKMNQFAAMNQNDDELEAIASFEDFLRSYRETLKNCKQVIFDLIASHGRTKQLVEFARIQQDYKWVINHYITNHQYKMAIRHLETLQKPSQNEELYYEFAPILMYVNPSDTVNMLIKVQALDPKQLIPALMRYESDPNHAYPHSNDRSEMKRREATDEEVDHTQNAEHRNQAIRYLVYCIEKGHEKSKDPAIHNYLISLYCKQNSEDELLTFIQQHAKKPLFDVKYALRLCHQEDKRRSCVELYKIMKLWEEAIRLALTIPYNHYELAKNIATEFCETSGNLTNKNEQKRLWLIIARHVVDSEADDIKQVLHIINESNVLSIEDILPHLKDFTEIGPFKRDIKQSLEKYSKQIVKLQKEMDSYTENAKEIRKDTKNLLLRSSMITSNRKCDLSHKPILNTQFILFPCTHIFRFDALRQRIFEYRQQIGNPPELDFKTNDEVIEYASRQCALCGDMMIDQVMRPFIDYDNEEDRKEAESWHVGDTKLDFIYNENTKNDKGFASKNQSVGTLFGNTQSKPKTVYNLEDINIDELGFS